MGRFAGRFGWAEDGGVELLSEKEGYCVVAEGGVLGWRHAGGVIVGKGGAAHLCVGLVCDLQKDDMRGPWVRNGLYVS